MGLFEDRHERRMRDPEYVKAYEEADAELSALLLAEGTVMILRHASTSQNATISSSAPSAWVAPIPTPEFQIGYPRIGATA